MILEAIMNADYDKSVIRFNEEKVEENGIVFIGDSFVSGYKANNYFLNENIINRGIAGDTAEKVLKRLDQIIKIKPSVVVINAGSNDLVRTKQTTDEIVKSILNIKFELESKIAGVKVYILTLQPVLRDHEITNDRFMKERTNEMIDEINDELEIFTKLLDTNSLLKDNFGSLKLEYTYDGLHLNEYGYKVFSNILANEIKELKINNYARL